MMFIKKEKSENVPSLDEAIAHARDVAEGRNPNVKACSRCAKEHAQLADWLEELKAYKQRAKSENDNNISDVISDVVEVVRCKDCKYCIKEDDYEFWCNGFCSPARLVNPEYFCSHGFNKSELCCCLNGTSEEAEAAIERVKARIGRVNNG